MYYCTWINIFNWYTCWFTPILNMQLNNYFCNNYNKLFIYYFTIIIKNKLMFLWYIFCIYISMYLVKINLFIIFVTWGRVSYHIIHYIGTFVYLSFFTWTWYPRDSIHLHYNIFFIISFISVLTAHYVNSKVHLIHFQRFKLLAAVRFYWPWFCLCQWLLI